MGPAARLFDTDDPTGQILGAWAGKELLRQLLVDLTADARPDDGIHTRLDPFTGGTILS